MLLVVWRLKKRPEARKFSLKKLSRKRRRPFSNEQDTQWNGHGDHCYLSLFSFLYPLSSTLKVSPATVIQTLPLSFSLSKCELKSPALVGTHFFLSFFTNQIITCTRGEEEVFSFMFPLNQVTLVSCTERGLKMHFLCSIQLLPLVQWVRKHLVHLVHTVASTNKINLAQVLGKLKKRK